MRSVSFYNAVPKSHTEAMTHVYSQIVTCTQKRRKELDTKEYEVSSMKYFILTAAVGKKAHLRMKQHYISSEEIRSAALSLFV